MLLLVNIRFSIPPDKIKGKKYDNTTNILVAPSP